MNPKRVQLVPVLLSKPYCGFNQPVTVTSFFVILSVGCLIVKQFVEKWPLPSAKGLHSSVI
jgi:hypothetical protein